MYALNFHDLYHGDNFIGNARFVNYEEAVEAARRLSSETVVVKVISI